jgi:hypothetical protein
VRIAICVESKKQKVRRNRTGDLPSVVGFDEGSGEQPKMQAAASKRRALIR